MSLHEIESMYEYAALQLDKKRYLTAERAVLSVRKAVMTQHTCAEIEAVLKRSGYLEAKKRIDSVDKKMAYLNGNLDGECAFEFYQLLSQLDPEKTKLYLAESVESVEMTDLLLLLTDKESDPHLLKPRLTVWLDLSLYDDIDSQFNYLKFAMTGHRSLESESDIAVFIERLKMAILKNDINFSEMFCSPMSASITIEYLMKCYS
ncbi:hypothetical protein [Photobacterium leiognathi]|uniref:hypothetical protein n=1 Tax=Photobacterium leiognathi TaxID=553611 RepID=UPI0029816339|nr:hypothetical protein [Photobacterium leiognathi]